MRPRAAHTEWLIAVGQLVDGSHVGRLERAERRLRIVSLVAFVTATRSLALLPSLSSPWRWWWFGARMLTTALVFACWWYVRRVQRDAQCVGRELAQGCSAGSDLPRVQLRSWFTLIEADPTAHVQLLWLINASSLRFDGTLSAIDLGVWGALALVVIAQLAVDAKAYRAIQSLGAVAIARPTLDRKRATLALTLHCNPALEIEHASLRPFGTDATLVSHDIDEQPSVDSERARGLRRLSARIPALPALVSDVWILDFRASNGDERASYSVLFRLPSDQAA